MVIESDSYILAKKEKKEKKEEEEKGRRRIKPNEYDKRYKNIYYMIPHKMTTNLPIITTPRVLLTDNPLPKKNTNNTKKN